MSDYKRTSSEQQTIWLPSDLVREAAKITYQRYYEYNRRERNERVRELRRIYRPSLLNKLFERKLVDFFILHPIDELDGERFIRLIELLPSDKIWNLQFAYSSWRPQINLSWGVYRRTLTNLGNPKVLVTVEEAIFLEQNSRVKLLPS